MALHCSNEPVCLRRVRLRMGRMMRYVSSRGSARGSQSEPPGRPDPPHDAGGGAAGAAGPGGRALQGADGHGARAEAASAEVQAGRPDGRRDAADSITVVPVGRELTTQQAANLLNVSRQYLVRLLDEGQIPFRKTGAHRRLRIEDVLAFKDTRDKDRRARWRELSRLTQELGGYDAELK